MTTINSNQALGFINAVAGLKNISATINNAVKGIYSRTAKTSGAAGAGGLAYINEVLKHDAIAKGKSQSAKAVKALMLHLHNEGLAIGANIHAGKVYTGDEIESASKAVNTFFNETLQAFKDANKKPVKESASNESASNESASNESASNDTNSGTAENNTPFDDASALPTVGYDDALKALIIPSDALVMLNDTDVLSFGALVAMYNELKAKESAIIADLVKPLETTPNESKKAVNA